MFFRRRFGRLALGLLQALDEGVILGALGGLTLIAAGFALLAFAGSTLPVYTALALTSVGSGFANVDFSSLISLYSGADEQGKVLGVFRSLGSLARAVGPLVAGVVFWWYGSLFTYALSAALLARDLAAAERWVRERRHSIAQPGGRGR